MAAARAVAALAAIALAGGCAVAPEPADEGSRPPVEVRAAVDRAVATTGDLLTYSVEVDHAAGLGVEIPEVGSEIAGFRIVDTGAEGPETRRGRTVVERWYRLRADLVGSYVLPPVTVAYRPAEGGDGPAGTVETSALFVEVESVLPEGEEATDIRGLKPLRRSRPDWPWGAIAAAAAAALAVTGAFLWWRRRERPQPPPIPADRRALERLEALRRIDLTDPEGVRRFHFGLSEVVRAYVEDRFAFNATDRTSEEIHAFLPSLAGLGAEPRARLERLLEATDRVKFAEHAPCEAEIEGAWEDALGFVEATRPRPPQAADGGEVARPPEEERAA